MEDFIIDHRTGFDRAHDAADATLTKVRLGAITNRSGRKQTVDPPRRADTADKPNATAAR
jgi:hypothetical protein